jgi:hypothetical protein
MSALFDSASSMVRKALAKHPEVALVEREGAIKVLAQDPDGFDVEMSDDGDEVVLWAGPYHEHVEEAENAAAAFMWMLTPAYRIVEVLRGKHTKSARLEREVDGKWEYMGATVLALPLFGKRRERVLQNRVLPVPEKRH